ncbi:MAG: methyltransferase domain-containing protein, partial [Acidimicrobiia bacterium]|nr:methyltransferase domain-containing protein [Acidimicrobiia bacterium]
MTDQLIDPSIEQRDAIEDYYDEYSTWYEGERRDGYYAFVNDLEFEAVRGASTGARVLEIGCGTGLILERTAALAATAVGIDLSAGMASFSRTEKGLTTVQATADQLPFPDDSFDLVYSFKVLPHVPDIQGALREVDRVLAPGGRAFLEFYSPTSLKHLANRASIALTGRTPVYVRYDGLGRIGRLLPAGMAVRSVRGVRILGPTRHLYTAPVLGPAAVRLEGRLSTTALARLGGYLVVEVGRPEVRATAKPRLAVVVKYHPPGQRISGIVGFLTALHRRLAKSWDLHVVSYETEGRGARTVEVAGYQVHRVGFPFPVTSWRKARALRADAVLVVSGINDLRLAAPYFALLSSFSGRRDGVRRAFLQATHVAQRPPAAFTRMLRRYDSVVCAGPAIHDDLAPAAGDRAVLVRPGVDVAVLDAVRPAPKPRRLRYGFVNHLNPRKGADIAVPALAR